MSTLTRTARRRELWPNASVAELIAAARAGTNVATLEPSGAAVRRRRRLVPWAIAASLAAVLGLAAVALTNARLSEWLAPVYVTQIGEQRSITLADGSVVELNSRSRVRTRFSAGLRAVELLEGEAIFRVTKDAQRPFHVRSGASEIVAVGTAFNVNAEESRTIVTVLEGRVRVNHRIDTPAAGASPQLEQVELAVGEQVIVAPARPMIRVALRDTQKVISWTERRLIFEETTLAAAAAQFGRYSARAIRIDDAAIAARTINGVFDATDPASLIEFLRADQTVEVLPDGDGWIVRRPRAL